MLSTLSKDFFDEISRYSAVYRYLDERECLENLMAKLTWEQFCAQQYCDVTQRVLKVAIPVGILGVAAFVCYYSWKKTRKQEASYDEPPLPKESIDTSGTAKERVIRAMNKLNNDILQLNTIIGNCDLELVAYTETDFSKTARLEHHRKNLVVMLDNLIHHEVDSMSDALSTLRPISPMLQKGTSNGNDLERKEKETRDAELKAELAELLGEESRKNLYLDVKKNA
ncbi:unnamed protein product, partial [Mesorhabditis belari]|uniref:Uncharacterized protein n=1 Tax=Mesorhabditis belari TaxID=2138241 RepID=A0AAF3F4T2_9BILA